MRADPLVCVVTVIIRPGRERLARSRRLPSQGGPGCAPRDRARQRPRCPAPRGGFPLEGAPAAHHSIRGDPPHVFPGPVVHLRKPTWPNAGMRSPPQSARRAPAEVSPLRARRRAVLPRPRPGSSPCSQKVVSQRGLSPVSTPHRGRTSSLVVRVRCRYLSSARTPALPVCLG
ncbi:hypothetical protein NDU88_004595 [Pleurodeles waltl]|uniref:Uncharacterized protein n=1 Tax=Pleurodeles waltl TaxID=8319 RepID=A0AAV7RHB6_PLEWA|nr:hypothetical protein NDU88_004595 [Pleurodeles waltl]